MDLDSSTDSDSMAAQDARLRGKVTARDIEAWAKFSALPLLGFLCRAVPSFRDRLLVSTQNAPETYLLSDIKLCKHFQNLADAELVAAAWSVTGAQCEVPGSEPQASLCNCPFVLSQAGGQC